MENSYRGTEWDWRRHPARNQFFRVHDGEELADIKHRALAVLRSYTEAAGLGFDDLDGPLWALVDTSHGNEKVKAACIWFKVAAAYSDDEIRLACCREAYEKIERALRVWL